VISGDERERLRGEQWSQAVIEERATDDRVPHHVGVLCADQRQHRIERHDIESVFGAILIKKGRELFGRLWCECEARPDVGQ